MTDPILQAAFDREAELEQELEKIRLFIQTFRSLAKTITPESANTTGTNVGSSTVAQNPVDGERNEAAREAVSADAAPAKRVRVRDNPKPADVVAAAVEVIRAAGRPMTRREIHLALQTDHGLWVRGADPIKALGTMLWRSGRRELVQFEGLGYWDRSRAYSPVGYDPHPDFDLSNKAIDPELLDGYN